MALKFVNDDNLSKGPDGKSPAGVTIPPPRFSFLPFQPLLGRGLFHVGCGQKEGYRAPYPSDGLVTLVTAVRGDGNA